MHCSLAVFTLMLFNVFECSLKKLNKNAMLC